jgi:hypothetical protein
MVDFSNRSGQEFDQSVFEQGFELAYEVGICGINSDLNNLEDAYHLRKIDSYLKDQKRGKRVKFDIVPNICEDE